MPKVGSGKNAKEYPYTPAGRAAARAEAARSGQKMTVDESKMPMRGGKMPMVNSVRGSSPPPKRRGK